MSKLRSWSQLSEIQKIAISEFYYSIDVKKRGGIRRHLPGCPCDLKSSYTKACYQNFFISVLEKFNTDINLEKF